MPRRLLQILFILAVNASAQWLPASALRSPARPLSSDMLAAHNQVRARVGVPPLSWSSALAARARDWATFLLSNNQFYHRPNPDLGENLFEIQGGHASPTDVLGDWASEAHEYNYHANTCRGVCGHYTQVVWRGTKEVGCAVARQSDREVWVCNYAPPGNWIGERPY